MRLTFPRLDYPGHSEPMDGNPVNVDIFELAMGLSRGRPASVILEPGDVTRYEFIIVPLQSIDGGVPGWGRRDDLLMVTRTASGNPVNTTAIFGKGDLHRVHDLSYARKDRRAGVLAWEDKLFRWWFGALFILINAARLDTEPVFEKV